MIKTEGIGIKDEMRQLGNKRGVKWIIGIAIGISLVLAAINAYQIFS